MSKSLKAVLASGLALGITGLMYRQAIIVRDKALEQDRRAADAAEHLPLPVTIPSDHRGSALNTLVYLQVDADKKYLENVKEQRRHLEKESAAFRAATQRIEKLEKIIEDEQKEADEAFEELQSKDSK